MQLSEQQIESLAPNPAAFTAGKKLSGKEQWLRNGKSDRAIWGEIKGSGSSPYLTQIDVAAVAYKCTCPSRQFPCKHSIALLLLHCKDASVFQPAEEPEWVTTWMDKRVAKENKPEPVEKTPEDEERAARNKEKTQTNRLQNVQAGVTELELWLKDLVRIGYLELPNKSKSEFDKVAARMVDAKAPGLAGWVKAFSKLNYEDGVSWQQEAIEITAKLFLLIKALKNYDTHNPLWQNTLRNLSGWSQSTKELLADASAETCKDVWLVGGQELELTEDEITIQRNWMIGCNTNRTALILNFGTKFTPLENSVLPGSVVEGELAFFPSVLPQRAVMKLQRKVTNELETMPIGFDNLLSVQEHKVNLLRVNPWINDIVIILKQARLINTRSGWFVADAERRIIPVVDDFDFQKIMRWLTLTGNDALDMTLVLRNDSALPLGVFNEQRTYTLL